MALELRRRGRRVALAARRAGSTEPSSPTRACCSSTGRGSPRSPPTARVAPVTLSLAQRRAAALVGRRARPLRRPPARAGDAGLRLVAAAPPPRRPRRHLPPLGDRSALPGRRPGAARACSTASTWPWRSLRRRRPRRTRRWGSTPTCSSTASTSPRIATAAPWPTAGQTILFVGRDEPRKGRQVLLEAARSLRRGRDDLADGRARCRARAPARRCPPRVARRDQRGGEASPASGGDVLCAPSLGGESFGMVLLEGLAAGARVVASDIDGYRQALGGARRCSCAPGDPAALAAVDHRARSSARGPERRASLTPSAGRSAALMDAYEDRYELARSAEPRSRRR